MWDKAKLSAKGMKYDPMQVHQDPDSTEITLFFTYLKLELLNKPINRKSVLPTCN